MSLSELYPNGCQVMENNTNAASFLFLLFVLTGASQAHRHRSPTRSRPTKLFVFGDSYADTGNVNVSGGPSWHLPSGVTFPGKPAGRFSDGRILTDFVAKFVGLRTPIAYRWRKRVGVQYLKNGMNFAYGGSGVLDTLSPYPNMTSQIGFFKDLLHNSVFTQADVRSSVALVTLSGNDYNAYMRRNGSPQGWVPYITSVVNQLRENLKVISGLGVRKIAVAGLPPLGCLPLIATKQCNDTLNALVGVHNRLLEQAVATLNNETNTSTFIILDLYTSFTSLLNTTSTGGSKFGNPLKECCAGTSAIYSCGSVDAKGVKQYTVCEKPESTFFWDGAHPTQAGWSAVYATLQPALEQLLH